MKKLVIGLAAAAMLAGGVAAAQADEVANVPGVGRVYTSEGGYTVVAEGEDGNGLGPLAGFVSVRNDGQVCADDNGHAADGDSTNDPDSSSPTCSK